MPDKCCCPPEAKVSPYELHIDVLAGACPTNNKVGKLIDILSLKAMLSRPLTDLRPVDYRFCPDTDCPTVYYSEDGMQTFMEVDLRERVFQKHPQEADVFVCYCFRHTYRDVSVDAAETGGTKIVAVIYQAIQNGQCACEIRNPQGCCCLGNVSALVKELTAVL
jgi:hypothetical protein